MPKFTVLIFLLLGLFFEFSYAEVLIIDRIQKKQNFETPQRGMTMDQVILTFGEPEIKKHSVGEPPITIWKYQKFSVYFEKSWVINSVINKASPEEKGPKFIDKE